MSRQPGMLLVLIVLLVSSCTPQSVATPAIATLTPAAGLANPASVFCQKQGFRLELRTDTTGSQTGICHFPDGSQCDEWAYYRGECGPAGQADAGITPAPSSTRVAGDLPLHDVTVGDAMTADPVTLTAGSSLEEALDSLRLAGVRRAPVVDDGGRVVGILSIDDVLDHIALQLGAVAGSLRHEQAIERLVRP